MIDNKEKEEFLLMLLEAHKGNKNMQAIVLQVYIQEYGALRNEIGEKVKELLK